MYNDLETDNYTIAHLVSAFTAEIQAPNSPKGYHA